MKIGIEILCPLSSKDLFFSCVWAPILDYPVQIVPECCMMFSANCFEIHPGSRKVHVHIVSRSKDSGSTCDFKIFTIISWNNETEKNLFSEKS